MSSLVLTADTLLGTPTIGSTEFDGKVFYNTPQGTQRGVIPGAQFYRLNADLAGANVTTAQNIFGVGVTLSTATVYAFEMVIGLSKTAGTTAHSVSMGLGGSATLNNIAYNVITARSDTSFSNVTDTAASQAKSILIQTATSTAVTVTGITSAAETVLLTVKGTVSINGGGTFIPQYTLSAAPGGAYSTVAGSYINIYPIGASGANISVGAWA
jgi:hypothetical protein